MDKSAEQNKNQFYIVSLDNGIRQEEPVSIEVFNSFSDGSQLVQLNNSVFGVYKSNSTNPETMYIDDYDIIKADIAELFDVDHEETRRIVTDDINVGVFTSLNYSKDIETRISATTILNHVIGYINGGQINPKDVAWISETFSLPKTEKGNGIKDHNQIENIINLALYSLTSEIEAQTQQKMTAAQKDLLRKSFIRMILFDFIVGRKYRGLDYYLITSVDELGMPVWTDAHLSPISVSNSQEKDLLVGDNEYMLINRLIDRDELIKVLFERFYREIKKLSEALNDAKKLYKDAINRIIYNNTDLEHAIDIEKVVNTNFDIVAKLQEEKERQENKENKINKIEKTMATQSLNVRVTAKLDLIQKKYPINPKDHPELLNKKKIEKERKENVKLVVENKKAGFATTAVIISIIALICGIGFGIAYVLVTLGG
jgi:hypothetical protein